MMLAVLSVGWLAFNAVLIHQACFASRNPIQAAAFVGRVRIFVFTALAWIVGPAVGSFVGLVGLRRISLSSRRLTRGAIAGACAGYLGWFAALVLIFIGYRVDGQAPLAAIIASIEGAVVNAVLFGVIACAWGRLAR
jgi:hypothetical protein